MKKQFSILLLVFAFVFTASAQENKASIYVTFSSEWFPEQLREVDGFLSKLYEKNAAIGIIIFYEGKYASLDKNKKEIMILPKRGETSCRVQAVRYHINSRRKIPLDRLLFVDGGFREEQSIEFWIVPKNAEMPKPTPTLDEMQYRKGQPFCDYRDFY